MCPQVKAEEILGRLVLSGW